MRVRSLMAATFLCLLTVAVVLTPEARAQTQEQRTGWYVVRPGDTLRGITARYLGSEDRWPDNHKLNPELMNPHFLVPGQRIQILLGDDLPARTARLVSVSRDVEESPTPLDWSVAAQEDLLLEKDGLRTREQSSSELELQGGERMFVTENSLVYLRERPEIRQRIQSQSIEIVRGQADLEAGAAKPASGRVEIVIGTSVARPKATANGASQARARRSEEGTAQVMVFKGESEVQAPGGAVRVGEGMGTSVPKDGKPTPPEKLLPAPQVIQPKPASKRATATPLLQWTAVGGADSYTIEICRDPSCGQLVVRRLGLEEASYQAAALEFGEYYWRATAVSPSGLDGYPAEGAKLTLVEGEPAEPPTVEYRADGISVERDDILYVGPGAELQLRFEGATSRASKLSFTLDGKPRGADVLQGPWSEGEHRLDLGWQDDLGNQAELESLRFFYDPTPPTIDVEKVAKGWRADRGLVAMPLRVRHGAGVATSRDARPSKKKKRKKSKKRKSWSPLDWSGGGWSWQPLDGFWRLRGPQEQLVLRTIGQSLRLEEQGLDLPGSSRAVLRLRDDGAGLASLRFGLIPTANGDWELQLEVQDLLGNVEAETWAIRSP